VAVLRVVRLTDRSGRYYLDDLAAELAAADVLARPGDGRTADGDGRTAPGDGRPGRWVGAGATAMGLRGPAGGRELRAVLSGAHPATGQLLRHRPAVVSGYDLTFAAPKSVSVLYGLASPELAGRVVAAHTSAVEQALRYVSTHAMAVRRRVGAERAVLGTDGVVGASFMHGVSRTLDPHLHTHVVVANLAHGVDGIWSAIDGRGIYAHARAAGSLYDAHLRHELTSALGAAWSRRASGALELEAIGPVAIGWFSARGAEIRAHLAERGLGETAAARSTPARARRVAWATTRPAKAPARTAVSLRRSWAVQAADAGVDAATLERALARGRASRAAPALDERQFAAALVRTLATTHAGATRRAAVEAWATAVETGAPACAVDGCVEAIARWGTGIGVAERACPLADLVAPPHLLRALGSRPLARDELATWISAASAIERYRQRWPVDDRTQPLGTGSSAGDLGRMPARRLAEHLAVMRRVADARRQLGLDAAREPGVPELSLGRG
jgi:conjugative relaxase-like TrwC/TraI family protein